MTAPDPTGDALKAEQEEMTDAQIYAALRTVRYPRGGASALDGEVIELLEQIVFRSGWERGDKKRIMLPASIYYRARSLLTRTLTTTLDNALQRAAPGAQTER